MNLFQYDFGEAGWGFVQGANGCWFGLDSNQQLTLGPDVVFRLARLKSVREPSGKVVHFVLSRPNASWSLNGLNPFTLHVLQNKDELRYGDQWVYFTTEEVPKPVNYSGEEKKCPRCKDLLQKNKPVVQCPNPKCRLVYHEEDGRKCWSYHTNCTCGHSTKMELSWKPHPNDVPERNLK